MNRLTRGNEVQEIKVQEQEIKQLLDKIKYHLEKKTLFFYRFASKASPTKTKMVLRQYKSCYN